MNARESNFELLRCLAMFMVLVIHANFISLPRPVASDLATVPMATVSRYLVESLGIVSVNVFVLISGWFRVKTDTRRVLKFVFQILFFWIGGYLACLLAKTTEPSLTGFLHCFFFTKWDWYIKAYLVLFIIAPILNTFVDHASEMQLRNVVIAFFLFQSTYSWIGGGSRFFVSSYGPLSFIGLYLLAQYVRGISGKGRRTPFDFPKYVDLLIFLASAILNTVFALILIDEDRFMLNLVYAYCSPLVILSALYLLLFFSKLEMRRNSFINWVGASSFAVYLLHSQYDIRQLFNQAVINLDSSFHGVAAAGMILLFLLFTFIVAVLLDQIRIWTWDLIDRHWQEKLCSNR